LASHQHSLFSNCEANVHPTSENLAPAKDNKLSQIHCQSSAVVGHCQNRCTQANDLIIFMLLASIHPASGMAPTKIRSKGQQSPMKEPQCLVSCCCCNDAHGSAVSKKLNELCELAHQMHRGTTACRQPPQEEDHVQHCDQFLNGTSMFEPLF